MTEADSPSARHSPDPFASLWDEKSLARQRRLLQRVQAIAESRRIALYLYWGTLLGHVRERRILPWDDDVDLALFDTSRYDELYAAMQADGLLLWEIPTTPDLGVKICDPAYAATANRPWTWPFVDVFIYSGFTTAMQRVRAKITRRPPVLTTDCPWPVAPIARALVLPGRITTFEGARCWEPERPLAVLDRQYRKWRMREKTHGWNHRHEHQNDQVFSRKIRTNRSGYKIL